MGHIHLVTADGSVNCMDTHEQETQVQSLICIEIVTALRILGDGGRFVLKIFTFFEAKTIQMLYLLRVAFDSLHLFKPVTSKWGNSEVYVIALGYRKSTASHLIEDESTPLTTVPDTFVDELVSAARCFSAHQIDAIERNVFHFHQLSPDEQNNVVMRPRRRRHRREQPNDVHALRLAITREYCHRYGMEAIHEHGRLVPPNGNGNKLPPNVNATNSNLGSFRDVKNFAALTLMEKCANLRAQLGVLLLNLTDPMMGDGIQLCSSQLATGAELRIRCGRTINRIASSKFVRIDCLKLLLAITELPSRSGNESTTMITTNTDDGNVTITIDIAAAACTENYDIFEKNLFATLIDVVTTTRENAPIITIVNWLLLTQFSVGLLWLLTQFVYDRVTLFGSGGTIILERLKVNGSDRLIGVANEVAANDNRGCCDGVEMSVLCLVAVNALREEHFYDSIVSYNTNVCIKYCGYLLEEK